MFIRYWFAVLAICIGVLADACNPTCPPGSTASAGRCVSFDGGTDGSIPLDGGDGCPAGQLVGPTDQCHVPGWTSPVLLETSNAGDSDPPDVAIDPAGNAAVVWAESDGTRYNIWTNRHTLSGGWGIATLLETDNAGDAYIPWVSLDDLGNGLAVWKQSDGTRFNIQSNRYNAGSGWQTATLLETDNQGNADGPSVAMDDSGGGFAVWRQSDGTLFSIWANRYDAGTGWGTAMLLEHDDTGDAGYAQVAMNGAGFALTVWPQSDGTRRNIWASAYEPGIGWGTPSLIETNDGDAALAKVAVDDDGDGCAVWEQANGTRDDIWANHYATGAGWGTAALVETDDAGPAQYPRVAMDNSGTCIAVWEQSDGTRDNIWANQYTTAGGWDSSVLIETDDAGDAQYPRVAVDAQGDRIVVWQQSDGTRYNIWANRYVPGIGWSSPSLLETDNAGDAARPEVATDWAGHAVASWRQSDGTRYNIWAATFE